MRFAAFCSLLGSLALVGASTESTTPIPTPTTPPVVPHELQHLLQPRQATSSGSSSSSVSIPADAAAGGLTYTNPAATDAVSYYKIASGNPITFGWNYTSLYVTPSSLTFEARCSANSFTYPVGPTTGIPGSETQIVWDPYEYAQSANAIPFAQASYTLRVYDERGIDAAATAGYFNGANSIVNFALYSPAAYTPLASGWTCVTCSLAAVSAKLDHPLLIALPVTVALVLIGGAGVFHR
ncbi:hypothetical protein BCR35DRAFT_298934 [Leucosporidium creatinivorum]|uniref:DUF7137 domain-containing protein n=1 Tax=Leucosporidium creatinivorum TaxID=106004 RepID=A0A1Y2G6P7_9BASI|nr:hypothetical protein BCR35DRAFT_298934 [Leucosporidium creatinivorum]